MAAARYATTNTWASMPIAKLRWTPSALGRNRTLSAASGWNSCASSNTALQFMWPKLHSTPLEWTPRQTCSGWKRSSVEYLSERLDFRLRLLARPFLCCGDPLANRGMRVEEQLDNFRGFALREVLVSELLHRADKGRDGRDVFPSVTISFALVPARDRIQGGHQQKT